MNSWLRGYLSREFDWREKRMAYFPFFVDLKDRECYIFGGGTVASRKVEALLEFEAKVTVIAPKVCDEILQRKEEIEILLREYQEEDLDQAFFVIAATNQSSVNAEISEACEKRKLLVNAVDQPENCSCLFPAYIKQGDITIGVTTSGKSPVMAGHIKKLIADQIPSYYGRLVQVLGSYREIVKHRVPAEKVRARIFKKLAKIGVEKEGELLPEDVELLIKQESDSE
jgi:uroporphyrin-III C-methyltransferase/precorrin-2 dehydrogenase/sirohydrochlorin ferrochelatase/precorrin-2 dehydrogenase/sirohydrochlorin ferrochelatase